GLAGGARIIRLSLALPTSPTHFSLSCSRLVRQCSDAAGVFGLAAGNLLADIPNADGRVVAGRDENLVSAFKRGDAAGVAAERADFFLRGHIPQVNLVVAARSGELLRAAKSERQHLRGSWRQV